MLAIRVFAIALWLGPIPMALVVLALSNSPLLALVPVVLGALGAVWIGIRSPVSIGVILEAAPLSSGGAADMVLSRFGRTLDELRQSRRQKGMRPEFLEGRSGVELQVFPSARAIFFPVRSFLVGRQVLFISSGAISGLSEEALADALARALVGLNSRILPARCWSSALVERFLQVLPTGAMELFLAFETDGRRNSCDQGRYRTAEKKSVSVPSLLLFWILSPWVSALLKISRRRDPWEAQGAGLLEAIAGQCEKAGAGMGSERNRKLDSQSGPHVSPSIDGLIRGV